MDTVRVLRERRGDWEETSIELQATLTEIVKKYHPEATWRRDNQDLVGEFKTTVYDIHAIDEEGNISAEAHQETGHQYDGIIILLSPAKVRIGRESQAVFGRSNCRYWQYYFTAFRFFNPAIRLDLKYGRKTDRKLMQEILASLEKRTPQAGQFD